jgi:hypothetical protein
MFASLIPGRPLIKKTPTSTASSEAFAEAASSIDHYSPSGESVFFRNAKIVLSCTTVMDHVYWAGARPRLSISTVTQSWFSRTIRENAVRPSCLFVVAARVSPLRDVCQGRNGWRRYRQIVGTTVAPARSAAAAVTMFIAPCWTPVPGPKSMR